MQAGMGEAVVAPLYEVLLARGVIKSKLGRILVAVRDKEDRVRRL